MPPPSRLALGECVAAWVLHSINVPAILVVRRMWQLLLLILL